MTNRTLHSALSIDTEVDNLGWPWTAISSNFLGILRYFTFLGSLYTNAVAHLPLAGLSCLNRLARGWTELLCFAAFLGQDIFTYLYLFKII